MLLILFWFCISDPIEFEDLMAEPRLQDLSCHCCISSACSSNEL